jgi:serine/threonine protein kinase
MAKQFGRWVVKEQIGEGGQGHALLVNEASDDEKRPYVLKRLKNIKRLNRFEKEVRAGLELDHPNIVKVVDKGLTNEPPYFVAEYCAGGSLTLEKLTRLSLSQRLMMFASVCRGVGYAHKKNIIHRDLKPDNIFIREDLTPVVGDFGICFITDDGERVTMIDEVAGSRWYTAPELAHGIADEVTPAADVYSLGKVLYWMLSGKIFDREMHRAERFDLTKGERQPHYYFVYDLFDRTIVEKPERRLKDANQVAEAVEDIIRRIEVNAHHIAPDTPQTCMYCGVGLYQRVVDEPARLNYYPVDYSDTTNFGLQPRGNFHGPSSSIPLWLIMACDYCGNVQMFRPDYAKDKTVWKRERREPN